MMAPAPPRTNWYFQCPSSCDFAECKLQPVWSWFCCGPALPTRVSTACLTRKTVRWHGNLKIATRQTHVTHTAIRCTVGCPARAGTHVRTHAVDATQPSGCGCGVRTGVGGKDDECDSSLLPLDAPAMLAHHVELRALYGFKGPWARQRICRSTQRTWERRRASLTPLPPTSTQYPFTPGIC